MAGPEDKEAALAALGRRLAKDAASVRKEKKPAASGSAGRASGEEPSYISFEERPRPDQPMRPPPTASPPPDDTPNYISFEERAKPDAPSRPERTPQPPTPAKDGRVNAPPDVEDETREAPTKPAAEPEKRKEAFAKEPTYRKEEEDEKSGPGAVMILVYMMPLVLLAALVGGLVFASKSTVDSSAAAAAQAESDYFRVIDARSKGMIDDVSAVGGNGTVLAGYYDVYTAASGPAKRRAANDLTNAFGAEARKISIADPNAGKSLQGPVNAMDSARTEADTATAEWRAASEGVFGQVAVGIGVAKGPE